MGLYVLKVGDGLGELESSNSSGGFPGVLEVDSEVRSTTDSDSLSVLDESFGSVSSLREVNKPNDQPMLSLQQSL